MASFYEVAFSKHSGAVRRVLKSARRYAYEGALVATLVAPALVVLRASTRLAALAIGAGVGLGWVIARVLWRARLMQPVEQVVSETLNWRSRRPRGSRAIVRPAESGSLGQWRRSLPSSVVDVQAEPAQPAHPIATVNPTWNRLAPSTELIAALDVPSGWQPDPDVSAPGPHGELAGLANELFQLATRGCFTLRVASGPECEDTKSSVAAYLAWLLAESGHARVLLMEADFERPAVHRVMRMAVPAFKGLSQQLHARAQAGALSGSWSVLRCAPSLHVLAEGRVRAFGVHDSAQFSRALAEQRRYYDIILLDGPVIGGEAAHELDALADGVLFVTAAAASVSATREQIGRYFPGTGMLWLVRTSAAPRERLDPLR